MVKKNNTIKSVKQKVHSQQRLSKIFIQKLKGLKNIEIDFSERPLVAIMAPNGSGKSTILHALACVYKRPTNPKTKDDRFSKFFVPTSNNDWKDSSLTITYSYSIEGKKFNDTQRTYCKNSDRWCRYEDRPSRYVRYIGIETCVPAVEKEKENPGKRDLNKVPLTNDYDVKVKEIAGYVMNRNYSDYCIHKSNKKDYIGVENDSVSYSSLSMGAGEQRIFLILKEVLSADKYSMFLIDEIDLLLHEDALSRLLDKLNEIASDRNLQIIFTTHAHSILKKTYIAFRHLYQTPEKTLCFNKTYPDFLKRLTGEQTTQLEIYVEDDLSKAIIDSIAKSNGIKRFISVSKFGTWSNGITAACGLVLNNKSFENKLFVLDGDVETSDDQKIKENIEKRISGNDPSLVSYRNNAFGLITRYLIPSGKQPEEYYHSLIIQLDSNMLNEEEQELYNSLKDIVKPKDRHDYFKVAIQERGDSIEEGYSAIIRLLMKCPEWNDIIRNVSDWIMSKKDQLKLPINS